MQNANTERAMVLLQSAELALNNVLNDSEIDDANTCKVTMRLLRTLLFEAHNALLDS